MLLSAAQLEFGSSSMQDPVPTCRAGPLSVIAKHFAVVALGARVEPVSEPLRQRPSIAHRGLRRPGIAEVGLLHCAVTPAEDGALPPPTAFTESPCRASKS